MSTGYGYSLGKNPEAYIKLRTKVRKRLDKDVEAFLANGGQIVECDSQCNVIKKVGLNPESKKNKND